MSHKFISATHDKKTLTAMYKMADGTIYIRKGGTIPWRLQNPGDVRPNRSKGSEYLQPLRLAIADTASGQFSMFGSEEDGWETKKKLLKSPLYRDCTIPDMAEIYAPEKDNNNPEQYAEDVMAWSGVSGDLTIGDMDDTTLESVMQAMKKKEGYYNLKETRVEKWVYTTNVSITDGTRPISDCPLDVTLGSCEYAWKTNEYGDLPPIVHLFEGMNIEIKATNSKGEKETIYSATAGDKSKNIILTKKFTQYKANTLAHTPKVPREKSQPQPIEYVVQSGDVLSKIATRYNVSTSELAENNGIKDANKIYPGQKIVIYGKKEPDYVDLSEQVPWEEKGVSYSVPSYSPSDGGGTNTSEEKVPSTGGWIPDAGTSELPPPNTGNTSSDTGSGAEKKSSPSGKSETTATTSSKPASSKTQNTTQKNKEKLSTTGSKNSGNPVAVMCHEQKDASWMEVAFREASERWRWGQVKEGAGGINYHSETGINKGTMVGDNNAWCASFVNYCLKCACYPISINANSQYFSESKKFIKIDSPVYGAIVVFHVPHTERKGHVTLVYCKTKDGEICVLGGNQGNSVTINPMNKVYIEDLHYELIGYYVPASYGERANEIINSGGDLTPVYNNVYEVRKAVKSAATISDETNTR
ncbi:TPA: LysM peptidoglycan-binding domain-containing protein [Citrobacter werkmanii]